MRYSLRRRIPPANHLLWARVNVSVGNTTMKRLQIVYERLIHIQLVEENVHEGSTVY